MLNTVKHLTHNNSLVCHIMIWLRCCMKQVSKLQHYHYVNDSHYKSSYKNFDLKSSNVVKNAYYLGCVSTK